MGRWRLSQALVLAMLGIVALLLLLAQLLSRDEVTEMNIDNYTERLILTRDIYEPGYSQSHPELCPKRGASLRMLILVASAPNNTEERNAVRQTWGYYARLADVALAFMLGSSPGDKVSLAAEDGLFGDMIMGNSVDSYPNLTLKTLSMLEWADAYCPHAPWVLKTDDDVFVNVPRLLLFTSAPERARATRSMWGSLHFHPPKPNRSKGARYYISSVQFPGAELPIFASGAAYLLTADAVRPLLAAAPDEPYIPLEDVFVTGILAGKAGVRRVGANEFYVMSSQPCKARRNIARMHYRTVFSLWRRLLDLRTKCQN